MTLLHCLILAHSKFEFDTLVLEEAQQEANWERRDYCKSLRVDKLSRIFLSFLVNTESVNKLFLFA